MDRMQTQEMISALADGQLRGKAFARGVAAAAGDPGALETWHTYHVIGDVLRSGEFTPGMVPQAFLSRVQSRLLKERGADAAQGDNAPFVVPATRPGDRPAANDASFRWKVVAGFASLTAMAAIGWTMTAGAPGKPQESQLATGQPATVVASGRGAMIRDPKLDEFLAAHRQLGGASALQMPAGFLRSTTFEGPAR